MRGVTRIAEQAATALVGPWRRDVRGANGRRLDVRLQCRWHSRRIAHLVRDGDRWRFSACREPRPSALPTPHVAIVALTIWSMVLTLTRQLRAAVHLRHVLVDSVQRRGRARAVPAAADPTRDARPYRVWGYPIVPLVFVLGSTRSCSTRCSRSQSSRWPASACWPLACRFISYRGNTSSEGSGVPAVASERRF